MSIQFSSIRTIVLLLGTLLLGMGLMSFEAVPHTPPPSKTKRASQHQKRAKKRRIQSRQQRSKKRSHRRLLRRHRSDAPTAPWGVLGMVASILAIMLIVIGLGISAAAALGGGGAALGAGTALFVIGLILGLAGLAASIVGLVLHRKDPQRYIKPGFAIAGLIIGGVFVGFFLLVTVGSLFA